MNKVITFFLFIGFGMLLAIVSGVISKVIDNMIDKDKDLHMLCAIALFYICTIR